MSDSERPDILVLSDPPLGRPRLKRLRLALILFGLSLLALVSTAFGMMMAVASDLPELENRQEFRKAQNSLLTDVHGTYLATLADQGRIIIPAEQIAPVMQHAIIAIEDQRFYQNDGVDLRGIGRALWQDVTTGRAVQGGSTITQQFVKNATQAQNRRTIFEKVREAALAYHLTRKWPKTQDPHGVPQLDLLRQRRLRDRVGGAHVLRPGRQPLRLRQARAALREGAQAARGGAAGRHGRLADGVRPDRRPAPPPSGAATSCSRRCSSRAT